MIEIRSLRDLLRLLFIYQREFKLAALSAVVIIVLGAFLLPAKYESNARLLVKPGRDSTLPIEISNRQALVMPSTQRDPIVDEERLLTGRPIVRQVAERYLEVLANRPPPEGLWKRTKFYVKKAIGAVFDGIRVTLETFGVIEETTAVERLAKDLEKKFEVTHAAGSTVMEISFTWSEPEVAQEVVKAWIEIYMEERTQALGRKSLYAFYEAQTADSAAQIKSYKAQILKHLNEIGASSIEDRLQDLFAVAALLLEVAGDPAQVVVELHPAGIEGAQVDEVDQAIVLVQVVDEGIRAGGVAQGHQVLEEGDLQLALRHQGVAVPAVVALLVQEQHFQGALRLGPFLEGNRQGDIGRAEADTDEIVNHGGCSCLSHFQFLWIGPLSSGSDKSRAALEGHLLTRNEDREMKFKRCRARIAKSVGFPFAHAHPTVLHRVDDVLFHQAAGNIEMFGDLRMGQAVQLAQQEGTAADGRQLGQRALQVVQALPLIDHRLRRGTGQALLVVQDLQGFRPAHPATTVLVHRQVERRPVQKSLRMLDLRLTGALQNAQIRVVGDIRRCMSIPEPGTEESQQLPIMVFQDDSCSLPLRHCPSKGGIACRRHWQYEIIKFIIILIKL